VDAQGWLHTGDIGEWQLSGTLRIIDRKKQIFKLSQGEYVAPDSVEETVRQSDYIAQVFVHGDSLKSCVIAVVVPDQAAIQAWAKRHHIPSESFTALCNAREVKRFIMEDMTRLGKEANLAYYEEVKDIYLHPATFTVQSGLLSASGLLMRQKLVKYFKPQLEDMYKRLD
jgi:long-chain acyl-CoA synthetase